MQQKCVNMSSETFESEHIISKEFTKVLKGARINIKLLKNY